MADIKVESQKNMILRALKDGRAITQNDAFAWFACTRLAARIADLRREGYNITTTMVNGKNRFGAYERHAQYRLEE